jgi:hypothetical protein
MEIRISVAGDSSGAVLESLDDWLRAEPTLRGRVRPVRNLPVHGEMGGLVDALTVAVGAGGSITVLASALRSWIEQPRRSSIRLRVRVEADGAREVELDADRVKGQEIESALERALDAAGR